MASAVDIPLLREDPEPDPSDVADTCCRLVPVYTNGMLFFFKTGCRELVDFVIGSVYTD